MHTSTFSPVHHSHHQLFHLFFSPIPSFCAAHLFHIFVSACFFPIMTDIPDVHSCLKVVSNRCRNLRKAIDRAKLWQNAAQNGHQLNPEQTESVNALTRKEALLVELQEILKKQTLILERDQQNDNTPNSPSTSHPVSKRAAKAARLKAKGMCQTSDKSSDEKPPTSHSSDPLTNGLSLLDKGDAAVQVDTFSTPVIHASPSPPVQTQASPDQTKWQDALQQFSDLKMSQNDVVARERQHAVRTTLSLFHITDYLRQPGSRDALLAYFQSPKGKQSPCVITSLDLDLLCYFNVMLTSPNGHVPHKDAVDVSTAHCLQYLATSPADAFKGTSYATLMNIVDTIASCPIMNDYGTATDSDNNARTHLPNGSISPSRLSNGHNDTALA